MVDEVWRNRQPQRLVVANLLLSGMPWSRANSRRLSILKTGEEFGMGDARDLMSSLADGLHNDPAWQFAIELLQRASTRDHATPAGQARAQLVKVLKADGLV